jgi:hypothetical protein
MELCRVTPLNDISGSVRCETHYGAIHRHQAARLAVELSERAERLRRSWDRAYGYLPVGIPVPDPTTTAEFVTLEAVPVNSEESTGISYTVRIVNRLQERIILWHKTETGDEEEIVTIPSDKTVTLDVVDQAAFVLRAEDRAIMDVIPPVTGDVHKVVK